MIDPALSYSTYLGGTGGDTANAVAVDAAGAAYITGGTDSLNFPTATPIQPARAGAADAFVAKMNAAGDALLYSTYLGGTSEDSAFGIALDSAGGAHVTGQTLSQNFPVKDALQGANGGQRDAFVAKLEPDGSKLTYSTYLGGSLNDVGGAIAVDGFGAVVTGTTSSPNFPLANALQSNFFRQTAFVSRLNPAGNAFEYSTYLCGTGVSAGAGIALDADGNAYVTGSTRSPDFPTINALQPSFGGKTLLKSTDGGASWAAINNGLAGTSWVRSLVIDPANPNTLYAGTEFDGIFKTTDGGGSWLPSGTGVTSPLVVTDLAIDPLTPTTVYAGTAPTGPMPVGVFKSTDSGASWINVFATFAEALVIDRDNPSRLFSSNSIFGVFPTTDAGATWGGNIFLFPQAHVRCLAIDRTTTGAVYVGTDNSGIFKLNGSFGSIPSGNGGMRCITTAPSSLATVYVGTSIGGVFKSTNSGGSWTQVNTGLTELSIGAIAVDPVDPSIVYAGATNNCFKSTNGGDTWSSLSIVHRVNGINEIIVDPSTPSTVYVAGSATSDAFVAKLNRSGSALLYSTFLGGSVTDSGSAIAVDSLGSACVVGSAASDDISASPIRPFAGGTNDALIARLSSSGSSAVFFTYFGGAGGDVARAIAVDSSGNAYVTGNTSSTDFPLTPDAIPLGSPCSSVCSQAFVSKLTPTGTALAYSTLIGGNAGGLGGLGFGIAVDSADNAYVAGQTFVTDFPTTPGAFQPSYGGGFGGDGFLAKLSASPTAVKLSSFEATSYDEGVLLKWQTGFEAENLGFNIYREVAGKRSLVNPELVAGSALTAGASTKLQAGQSYAWWDKGIADCTSRFADCRAEHYWLEEIDLNGTSSMHGPFSVRRVGGEPSRESRADLLSSLGTGEPRVSQMPLTYRPVRDVSSSAQLTTLSFTSASQNALAPGLSPAVKMTIKEEGWYRVTQQELVAAGFDSKTDPRRLQLHLEGTEQAILVRGEHDGSLDPGDAIEFFATGQDSAFTSAHVYWLVSGDRPGRRINTLKGKGKAGGLRSFAYTVERQDRTIYFSSLKNGDAENFFGAVLASQPVDQKVSVRHLDVKSGKPAELEIALQGVTDLRGAAPDHQVSVRLNKTEIGKLVFDGQANKVEKFAVKPSLLIEGDNVISLVSELGPSDVSLVDYVRLTYAHTYTCDQDSLRMIVPAGSSQTIAGFTSPSIRIVDITDPASVAELTGAVQRQGEGYAVTVNVQGQETRTLLALTQDRVKRPALIKLDQPSNWRNASNQANLLIVTHRFSSRRSNL
ncbi:MAG: SBBP repeat-containing protein [Acidobacteriota bacterium]